MKLKHFNDGKMKHQSHEVWVTVDDTLSIYGYGWNKEDATEECLEKVKKLIIDLQQLVVNTPTEDR